MVYNHKAIEKKWAKRWEEKKIFEAGDKLRKPKFYCLDMFPYPSGAGLHMGHAFVFSLGDILARFKRLQGFNVLYPIGYDSLGLPAENAAIKAKVHPKNYTKKSITHFAKQQKAMGWSYDWSRVLKTSDPEFYKWDQWIFLQMLKKGIAYKKKSAVNWCKKCESVLANEQVVDGCCWRHEDTKVEVRPLDQWFLKITDYAQELLDGLDKLDWPENAKKRQRNWIGKSRGVEINFSINGENWKIFTTRPDTIYGVTFMVVSAQHPKLNDLVTPNKKKEVETFLKKLKSTSEKNLADFEKEGVFTGSYAINPLTTEKIPVYAGNFVLADYGSGMVMAVPAHDKRDFEFAKKYGVKIKPVISPESYDLDGKKMTRAYTGEGALINSDSFNGLSSREAKEHIAIHLKEKGIGKRTVNFKLRDWLISRQRYWGTPIPVVYCEKCGVVGVDEKDLPVKLPDKVRFGKGNPLLTNKNWIETKCPKCNGKARRETDTMDTFANSSWYYLRYCDPKNPKKIFDPKKVDYWCPVDQYIGGPEHITMHLIYFRFYAKFLRDIGLVNFREPVKRYFTQGIVHASNGEKMSKSKGNVIEPMDFIGKYGADTLRLALVSFASPENDTRWDENIVHGSYKFLKSVYEYFIDARFSRKASAKVESKTQRILKDVTNKIEGFKHNLAVIKIRELFKEFQDSLISKEDAQIFLKVLHVYCPFVTEELWEKIGGKGFISQSSWPKIEEKKINLNFEKAEEAVEQLVKDINHVKSFVKKAKEAYVYLIPKELDLYSGEVEKIKKKTNLDISLYAVNDKNKHDPEGKAKKARPGKPGIYLE